MLEKDLARFWSHVRKGEGDSCWVWEASCLSTGLPYGQFSLEGGRVRIGAHRAIYEHYFGRKLNSKTEWVLHRCDNPKCVRFDHLFLGTPADNAQDMHRKSRFPVKRGEGLYISKLTEEAVMEIRANYQTVPLEVFAKKFNVNKATICCMLKGKTWQHLGPVPGWTGRKKRIQKSVMREFREGKKVVR